MKLYILLLLPSDIPHTDVPDPGRFFEFIVVRPPNLDDFRNYIIKHRPVLVISVGDHSIWSHLFTIHFGIRKIWVHFNEIKQIGDPYRLASSYIKNTLQHDLDATHPLISIITTTFQSKHKILRPLKSLLSQTYDNWEWIIWDDSPTNEVDTYESIKSLAAKDDRIRVYRAPQHSGFIGEMKEVAGSMARGKWIVEFDHDDIIVPQLFQWLLQIDKKYPKAEYVYSDCIELFENTDAPWAYGEHFSMGYGSYARQRVRPTPTSPNYYHHVAQTSPINPETLAHIVGIPNHVRIWKRSVYYDIGKHAPKLPVVDDYELTLRTFFHSDFKVRDTLESTDLNDVKWVRIVYPAYYQYRNEGGNNFTFLRNALIQELVAHIHTLYESRKLDKFMRLGWELRPDRYLPGPCWELERHHQHQPIEHFFVPEDQDEKHPCISIVMPTYNRPDDLRKAINSVLGQTYTNWILFVMGDCCGHVDKVLSEYDDQRIRYQNLAKNHGAGGAVPRNYALMMLTRTRYVAYLDDDNTWKSNHLSSLVPLILSDSSVQYVFSSMTINDKPLLFRGQPKRGRIDTSCVLHKWDLCIRYGYWKNREEAGYAHDWEFFSRWKNEKWLASGICTVVYSTDHNLQSYEELTSMYNDQGDEPYVLEVLDTDSLPQSNDETSHGSC